jgi:putative transposase
MPYWELNYHLVWATKNREPLLASERAALADRAIHSACREQAAVIYAVGIMPDHVHLAVSIPPRIAVADLVRLVKGGTSHLLNHAPNRNGGDPFGWQAEYGALSFGKRSLAQIVAYVENQADRHAANTLWEMFEYTERPHLHPSLTSDKGDEP